MKRSHWIWYTVHIIYSISNRVLFLTFLFAYLRYFRGWRFCFLIICLGRIKFLDGSFWSYNRRNRYNWANTWASLTSEKTSPASLWKKWTKIFKISEKLPDCEIQPRACFLVVYDPVQFDFVFQSFSSPLGQPFGALRNSLQQQGQQVQCSTKIISYILFTFRDF